MLARWPDELPHVRFFSREGCLQKFGAAWVRPAIVDDSVIEVLIPTAVTRTALQAERGKTRTDLEAEPLMSIRSPGSEEHAIYRGDINGGADRRGDTSPHRLTRAMTFEVQSHAPGTPRADQRQGRD